MFFIRISVSLLRVLTFKTSPSKLRKISSSSEAETNKIIKDATIIDYFGGPNTSSCLTAQIILGFFASSVLNIRHFCNYTARVFCLPFIHLAPGSCTWKFLSKRSSSVRAKPERFPPSSTGKTKQSKEWSHHAFGFFL